MRDWMIPRSNSLMLPFYQQQMIVRPARVVYAINVDDAGFYQSAQELAERARGHAGSGREGP
jgi:hypothetical protein